MRLEGRHKGDINEKRRVDEYPYKVEYFLRVTCPGLGYGIT
jgi:hypothetical protein